MNLIRLLNFVKAPLDSPGPYWLLVVACVFCVFQEQQEAEQIEEERRKQYDAEMSRLQREKEERERQRRIEEHDEIKKKAAREKLDQLKSTELGAKAFADLKEEEIAGMDVDDIMAKQVEQLEKDKKEMQEKLKTQEKKVGCQQHLC